MTRSFSFKTLGAAMAVAAICMPAFAGPGHPSRDSGSRGKAGSSFSRSVRGDGAGISRGGSHARGFDSGRGYNAGRSNTPILDALRDANGGSGIGNGQILRELGRRYDDERYYDRIRDREDDYQDAQRDAMIANAVVSVVGIIADAQARKHAQPVYAPAPAPVYTPAPAGHYETRRSVVQEGYYATERVWVPEFRDSSGAIVEGHYETHRRWVPPVYQETEVWVTPVR